MGDPDKGLCDGVESVALTKRPTSDGRNGHSTLERTAIALPTMQIFEEDEMQNYRVTIINTRVSKWHHRQSVLREGCAGSSV